MFDQIRKIATTFAAIVVGFGGLVTAITWVVVWVDDIEERGIAIKCEAEAELGAMKEMIHLLVLRTDYVLAEVHIENLKESRASADSADIHLFNSLIDSREYERDQLMERISTQESAVDEADKLLGECE